MQVLVLDDDAAVGRLVGRIAAGVGFKPVLATSSKEFRALYQADLPDVIVLDLRIADTDGVEELRFLKNKGYPNPLVLASGFDGRVLATTEVLARGLGLKVAASMTKPFRAPALQHVFTELKAQIDFPAAQELLEAIAKNQLVLEYQPIVTRRDGLVRRLEALIRWHHPKLGRLPPARFIPAAERTAKVMDAVTDWVVRNAIGQYEALRKAGFTVPMAVNVSGNNLYDGDFPDRLSGLLRAARIPDGHFCLEITASTIERDLGRLMEILNRLRLKGVDLAIDDFATGGWSLARLRQLPFSIIKIDETLVGKMEHSPDAVKTVEACLELAKEWEMETIAEGVETEATAARLVEWGVHALQGHLIAAAMPAGQVIGWLRQWSERTSRPELRSTGA